MSDPVRFLTNFAQALTTLTLYPENHPLSGKALDAAHEELTALAASGQGLSFTFLDNEVVYGRDRLRDLKAWEWSRRLSDAGIQRLEFEPTVTRDQFEGFVDEVLARLTVSAVDTSGRRQMRELGVRFGAVGILGLPDEATSPGDATLQLGLTEEAETLQWLQEETRSRGKVPLIEAEAVVQSLSVAMHGDRRVVLPLLRLKEFDQYTTTHSLNVSVLAMGLAESLGCSDREVRSFGVAGLLHDLGKIRIPIEMLTKPGQLTAEERRVMNQHPVDGARIILQSQEDLDMAAVVAYEHHIMLDGGGYPALHYNRECTLASRLVHVCDVYDALCTTRPYREAWAPERAAAYLEDRSGVEFDPGLVGAFVRLLRRSDVETRVLGDQAEPPPAGEPPAA